MGKKEGTGNTLVIKSELWKDGDAMSKMENGENIFSKREVRKTDVSVGTNHKNDN